MGIRDKTTAVDCQEEDGIVSVRLHSEKEVTEKAAYVLDCEGVVGTLKRKRFGGNRDFITTYQTFQYGIIALDKPFFYAFLQPAFSEYDAWFHVKADALVIGVSVKNPEKIKYYYDAFLSYLKDTYSLKMDPPFAGEIAGFLNPMGEGISAAIESGYCAANAIAEHFRQPEEVVCAYQEAVSGLRTYMQRQWNVTAQLDGTFSAMRSSNI